IWCLYFDADTGILNQRAKVKHLVWAPLRMERATELHPPGDEPTDQTFSHCGPKVVGVSTPKPRKQSPSVLTLKQSACACTVQVCFPSGLPGAPTAHIKGARVK